MIRLHSLHVDADKKCVLQNRDGCMNEQLRDLDEMVLVVQCIDMYVCMVRTLPISYWNHPCSLCCVRLVLLQIACVCRLPLAC